MTSLDFTKDRGIVAGGLPGWEQHEFERVQLALVDGQVEVVGLHIRRLPDSDPAAAVLTPSRLARLPLRSIAQLVASNPLSSMIETEDGSETWKALRALDAAVESVPPRPRGGSEEFSRAVANVVMHARAQRISTIGAVAKAWRVTDARANQYIAEARRVFHTLPDPRIQSEQPKPDTTPSPAVTSPPQPDKYKPTASRRVHSDPKGNQS